MPSFTTENLRIKTFNQTMHDKRVPKDGCVFVLVVNSVVKIGAIAWNEKTHTYERLKLGMGNNMSRYSKKFIPTFCFESKTTGCECFAEHTETSTGSRKVSLIVNRRRMVVAFAMIRRIYLAHICRYSWIKLWIDRKRWAFMSLFCVDIHNTNIEKVIIRKIIPITTNIER